MKFHWPFSFVDFDFDVICKTFNTNLDDKFFSLWLFQNYKYTHKRPSSRSALIVPKGATLAAKGEKQAIVQPRCKAHES